MRRHALTLLAALGWAVAGCGAFADAARDGGGGGGVDSELSFFVGEEERETLRQGQVEEFSIVFDTPPPWTLGEGDEVFLTRFEFRLGDERLEDVDHVLTANDGMGTVEVILGATPQARTGERTLHVDLAYASFGHPQRIHSGVGMFYILPAHEGADGSDAADGGGDP